MIRIGVLTPHFASGPEVEFPAMVPGRLTTCLARVSPELATVGVRAGRPTSSELSVLRRSLAEAAELLAHRSLHAIGYASTSTSYGIGSDEDAALLSMLSQRVGLPVSSTCASAVRALRTFGVERVAIVHPPWFGAELNELGAAYFRGEGFDVVSCASAALSLDPSRIEAGAVYDWISRHVGDEAEAVFVGGNGFRAAGAIASLEARLYRPILTSNQVLLWNLLASAGAGSEVDGSGRLFTRRPRTAGWRRAAEMPGDR